MLIYVNFIKNIKISSKTFASIDSTDSTSSGIGPSSLSSMSSSSSSGPTMTGYLWKSKDSLSSGNNSNSNGNNGGGGGGGMISMMLSGEYSKYWFSLSPSLASLVYWLDKHEQDIGKYPLGKYELLKCTHVSSQPAAHGTDCSLEFRVQFHQGQGGQLCLRAATVEAKLNWCEAIRRVIESPAAGGVCSKCKPKLVVNPMPLQPSPSSTTTSTQASLSQHEDGVNSNGGGVASGKRSLLTSLSGPTSTGLAKKNTSSSTSHILTKQYSKNK